MRKYGLKATFNLNSALLGLNGAISLTEGVIVSHNKVRADEVKELYAGMEVASHTRTHPLLTECGCARIAEEVIGDRLKLSELTGYPVRGFAYPGANPNHDRLITETLRRVCGVRYARTIDSTNDLRPPSDFLSWNPSLHLLDPRTDELISRFENTRESALLFLWGHAYELDVRGGWERAESIFSRVSSISDAVCMTNIEVYDALEGV